MVICKAHETCPRESGDPCHNEAYTVRRSDAAIWDAGRTGIATLRSQQAQQMAVYRQPPGGRKRSRADSQIL